MAVTVHWFETRRGAAPAGMNDNEQFQRIMDSSLHSLDLIWDAFAEQDEQRLINNLRGLKSSDGLLYLRFG